MADQTKDSTPTIEGTIAHDGVDSGNPVKVGGKASSTEPTAVGEGDRVDAWFDLEGRQQIALPSHVSTDNSTTATLGISGTFTGTGEDVSHYSTVTIQIDASHDSATDGMSFEFSTDNTNWDDQSHLFTYTAADGARRFQFGVTAQYFRFVYTNGGTGQSHFRVQTLLHPTNVGSSVHRIADNTDPDRSATLQKSAIIAQQAGAGDFVPVQSTAGGNLKVSVEEIDTAAGTLDVGGDVAHDTADSGNPVKVGLKAVAHNAAPTAVAAADRTDWYANRHGIPWVIGGHPNVVTTQVHYTAAQTNAAIVTVAAGNKIVVTCIDAMVDNATTVDVAVRVGFGATTTPADNADDVVLSHPGIAAGSGVVRGNGGGILGVGADGEDLRITSEVPTTGSLDVTVSYYLVPS